MRRLALLVLTCAPLIASAHGGEDHGEKKPAARAPGGPIYFPKETQFLIGVRTELVASRAIESRMTVPGKVIPRTDLHAQIYAPVAGRIVAAAGRLPLVGQKVKRGQVLAVVQQSLSAPESVGLATDRIKSESGVGQAKAALDQARRDLERMKGLSGVVAQKDVQQAELAAQLAEQELMRTQRERDLFAGAAGAQASGRLTRFPLVSPLSGVLVEAHATVGEQVDTSRALFTVLDSSVVWIEANVFADDVARVETAKEALVHLEAYQDQYFPARLFNLGQLVDEATRTVKVIFEAKNPDGRLRPGFFAEVAIGAGGKQEILAVPNAAVVETEGRRIVFLHTAPEEFVAREVSLGVKDGSHQAVKQGLAEGDRVVTVGTYQLRSAQGQ